MILYQPHQDSPPISAENTCCPGDKERTLWGTLLLSASSQREVQRRIKEKSLPHTAVPSLRDQVNQEPNMARLLWLRGIPSNLLEEILTEGGMDSCTGHYKFKGDPHLQQSPCHLEASYFGLLWNPFTVWCWFQIS